MEGTIQATFYLSHGRGDHVNRTLKITTSTTKGSLLQELIALILPGYRMVAAWVSWIDRDPDEPRVITTTNLSSMNESRFGAAMKDLMKADAKDKLFVEYEFMPRLSDYSVFALETQPTPRSADPGAAKEKQLLVLKKEVQDEDEDDEFIGEQYTWIFPN